ncbi:TetR family transcriptional regulator [Saccharopolyspora erythraea NRRL 2338]|uniref:TetR-family transcriptional regulator n=2 Tax=Saccharopolyspora erythraea TaxID=1836 RepID=A4FQN0_SACEN|nr:TetR/AcrR family transcriptional regulator [Saccharopolyspora erythraea]EQD87686.1 TetR family transcriptional regulator [Saccharopolyspora erythraea D]PFG92958.1 TetR family transcriptional regulator [Saccharopolyspora erythraea NRRL 2338]QRK89852.1 TetR/AcrR family transcriptional regulator [Saccharopolyspora erythraea]CAM06355.1 TetR-family transcriptional regulator [Saccharopolyspora erythraea NRRL 2338]
MAAPGKTVSYDDRVIAAAREVFGEQGFAAPMSEVAKRAGVGVASVYRRYPSKQALAEAVRMASLRRIIAEAEAALSEESDAWAALVRFMSRCLGAETPIGTVLPPVDELHVHSDEFLLLQDRMAELVERIVTAAQRSGAMRADVHWTDIPLLFKHLNPKLPIGEDRRAELRARYLTLVLQGLRDDRAGPLPTPAPDVDEWRAMCDSRARG